MQGQNTKLKQTMQRKNLKSKRSQNPEGLSIFPNDHMDLVEAEGLNQTPSTVCLAERVTAPDKQIVPIKGCYEPS